MAFHILSRSIGDHIETRFELLWPRSIYPISRDYTPWSSNHLSGALAAVLIILLVGALVSTVDIHTVLGVFIISNFWVLLPAFLQVCFPLILKVLLLSLARVFTSWFLCSVVTSSPCTLLTLLPVWLLTELVIPSRVCSSTKLELGFSAGRYTARCVLATILVWRLLSVGVG